MTKVIVINGSPSMNKGTTALILNPFVEEMKEMGAEVEVYYTNKLKINPCQGKFVCATQTPGECFQKDDMEIIYPKFHSADIWVFGTPLYVNSVPGPLKILIDRILIPMGELFLDLKNGHCHHPLREVVKNGKIVLVSNCGYWELDNFNLLIEQIKALCFHAEREYAGALLRPHGPAFRSMVSEGIDLEDIFEAAKEVGRQLIQTGSMKEDILKVISRDLLPLESYIPPRG
jgi:multimeric flavodoxin WrbA